tara:strand:- start:877 stop:2580 length:1704 start_codon:yes stop_codon:yes gene_type:complete
MNYKIKIIFLISSLTFFSLFLLIGFYSYPQEDALILYRYSSNLAETGQIVFNPNGIRTEGATDFLWMILLGILIYFKIDPYISTIIFSTLCFYLILNIFYKDIYRSDNAFFYILFCLFLLNLGQITGSSLYGFSTIVFCAIGLMVYQQAYRGNFLNWCVASVIFCLFRPEALIFFLPSIFLAYKSAKETSEIRLFLKYFISILCIGIIYFCWRYLYFENLLPLPLTVKQHGGELSINRFFATISQLTSTLFITLVLPIIIFLLKSRKEFYNFENKIFLSFILISISSLIYIFSISTGYQSQNIFFRYFAPVYFIVFLISMYCLTRLHKSRNIYVICMILIAIGSFDNSNLLNRIVNIEDRNISNPTTNIFSEFTEKSFANHPLLAVASSIKSNDLNSIMVTEAGALPFITKFKTYDLVGLNTEKFAYNPLMCKDIEAFGPELIEIDVGPIHDVFNLSNLYANEGLPQCGIIDKDIIYDKSIVDIELLKQIEDYDYFSDIESSHRNASVYISAQNVIFCLSKNMDYSEIFINQKSDQLYFIKNDTGKLRNSLQDSCQYKTQGYFKNAK